MARKDGKTKKEWLAEDVAKAVGAGKAVAVETVDFSDPNRPKTCLEVDFPILPINQIAIIEGNAGKPIYQMSKWWARRRSSVFRAMLLAASMKRQRLDRAASSQNLLNLLLITPSAPSLHPPNKIALWISNY